MSLTNIFVRSVSGTIGGVLVEAVPAFLERLGCSAVYYTILMNSHADACCNCARNMASSWAACLQSVCFETPRWCHCWMWMVLLLA